VGGFLRNVVAMGRGGYDSVISRFQKSRDIWMHIFRSGADLDLEGHFRFSTFHVLYYPDSSVKFQIFYFYYEDSWTKEKMAP
jgi:hypothetical protein